MRKNYSQLLESWQLKPGKIIPNLLFIAALLFLFHRASKSENIREIHRYLKQVVYILFNDGNLPVANSYDSGVAYSGYQARNNPIWSERPTGNITILPANFEIEKETLSLGEALQTSILHVQKLPEESRYKITSMLKRRITRIRSIPAYRRLK